MAVIPLWAKLLVLAAVLGGIFSYGYHRGVTAKELEHKAELADAQKARIKEYEDQLTEEARKRAASEAQSQKLNTDLAVAQAEQQKLQAALSRARLVIREPSSTPGKPDVVRLAPALRVCLNASALGSSEARANCEAFGVPAAAVAGTADH